MSIINNVSRNIEFNEAKPGMYITRNSTYMLYKSGDKYSLFKNKELVANNISYATVRSGHDINNGGGNEVSQLYYDNGNTSDIKQYYKQLNMDTLLEGLDELSKFLIERGTKISDYQNAIEFILRNKDSNLIGLATSNSIKGSKYKIYSKEQYELMAMYITAVKYYYPGFDITKDARIKNVLHDMAIDSTGVASKLEELVEKNEENKKSM